MLTIKGLDSVKVMLGNITTPGDYTPLLKSIGAKILTSIKTKTAIGIDYLNRKFNPYSEAYKKWKIKKGYSGIVNLNLTGQMMGSLQVDVQDTDVIVRMNNQEAIDKTTYNQDGRVPRPFMGVSPEVEAEINEMIDKYVSDLLRK